jgi:predicted amidohydrolase
MTVRVALIQVDCSITEPVVDRITRTLELVDRTAVESDADLVILPELWHVGAFNTDGAREHAQPITGSLVTALGELAARHGIWLHGGSFCEIDVEGQHYNTSVLFAPDGDLVASYRKVHLFGFDGGETVLMTGGEELVVAETPLGPTGLATCYDLRFPELFRALTDGDAQAFLLCSGWPTPRIEHWDILNRARAIENQAWFIACNAVGVQPGIELGGRSVVVDPQGAVVARAGSEEEVLVVDLDPEASVRWRAQFPVLADIRIG